MFLENELPKGWSLLSEKEARAMEEELAREVCKKHVLYEKSVNAVARRDDRDDFLFVDKNSDSIFLVHLTWSKETSPDWPSVDSFSHKGIFLTMVKNNSLG